MTAPDPVTPSAPTLVAASLKGLCPRCGSPTLFRGWIAFADRCRVCGLDIAAFNVGDGPAAFLILILGALVVGLAIALQLALAPPFWVQALVWIPVTLAGTVWSLRISKAALLVSEYRNAAREGRTEP
ncbi:DUF983 domain-containing protein [Sphingomonas sp. H39-1-10]|uniref:DUF983 domain-containing protein n=1 Tax=Sphingomonas pollutisoli TaxID=3030829 RepID=UPI0023B8CDF7|nr:DUF983 domain-containing protein [Sphingomonas pollutisoli]MDF0487116.1 DUF983 domain-containing protein [Sphingomonas pollutisoli]